MELKNYSLRNGSDFTVISSSAPGSLPFVLLADGKAHLLTADLTCPVDSGYDLIQPDKEQTSFFNVYRAADGGFVFGSRAFRTNAARQETRDAERALFGMQVTLKETERGVQACMV